MADKSYKVSIDYEARDNASKSLREIDRSASGAARSTSSLTDSLKALAAAAGVYKAFQLGKQAVFGYNNELEKSHKILGGINAITTGASIERSWDRATESMKKFNELSWKTGQPVRELMSMMGQLSQPLMKSGMKINQIEDLVGSVHGAAGAFGKSPQELASSVQRAIMTGRIQKDFFLRGLLAQPGVGVSDKAFTDMSSEKRASAIQKAFTSQSVRDQTDRDGSTFEGVVGNIKSHLEKLASSAGKPLFEAATKELQSWQAWIEKNRSSLEATGQKIGQHLVTAFGAVKEIAASIWPILKDVGGVLMSLISFAAEHKDTLIGLAKALIVMKVAEKIGGLAKAGAGSIGGMFGGVGGDFGKIKEGFTGLKDGTGSLTDAFSNMGKVIGGADGLIMGLGKVAALGFAIGKIALGETASDKARRSTASANIVAAKDYAAKSAEVSRLEESLKKAGIDPSKPDELVPGGFAEALVQSYHKASADKAASREDIIGKSVARGYGKREFADGEMTVSMDKAFGVGRSGSTGSLRKEMEGDVALKEAFGTIIREEAKKVQQASIDAGRGYDPSLSNVDSASRTMFFKEKMERRLAEGQIDANVKNYNQKVEITIQRVMAKDPNRWLAEMDDMVAQRARAPVRARGGRAPRSSPG